MIRKVCKDKFIDILNSVKAPVFSDIFVLKPSKVLT